jgi:hypothetical protein
VSAAAPAQRQDGGDAATAYLSIIVIAISDLVVTGAPKKPARNLRCVRSRVCS